MTAIKIPMMIEALFDTLRDRRDFEVLADRVEFPIPILDPFPMPITGPEPGFGKANKPGNRTWSNPGERQRQRYLRQQERQQTKSR